MTFDELSQKYDGIIPWEEKRVAHAGSYQRYYERFLERAERNFAARCLRTLQSTAAWRITNRYEEEIKETMLHRLQHVLKHARETAVKAIKLRHISD